MKFERYKSPEERIDELNAITGSRISEIKQSVFDSSISESTAYRMNKKVVIEYLAGRIKIDAEQGENSRQMMAALTVMENIAREIPSLTGFYLQTLQGVSSLLRQYEKNILN